MSPEPWWIVGNLLQWWNAVRRDSTAALEGERDVEKSCWKTGGRGREKEKDATGAQNQATESGKKTVGGVCLDRPTVEPDLGGAASTNRTSSVPDRPSQTRKPHFRNPTWNIQFKFAILGEMKPSKQVPRPCEPSPLAWHPQHHIHLNKLPLSASEPEMIPSWDFFLLISSPEIYDVDHKKPLLSTGTLFGIRESLGSFFLGNSE